MHFFKMPNSIFSYKPTSKAAFVYAYLISRMNSLHTTIAGYDEISKSCHMNRKTAIQAVRELQNRDLVVKTVRRNQRGRLKNRYFIRTLPGGWFKVDYQIFQTKMKSTDFLVYCFIQKCMNRAGEAFPSINKIARATSISRGRAVQAIQYLRQYSFVNYVRRHYKRTKAYRNNRYLSFRLSDQKKKAHFPKQAFRQLIKCPTANYHFFGMIIEHKKEKVNCCSADQGSLQITLLLPIPTNSS